MGQNAEAGASSRNTTLWNVFKVVIETGRPAMPAKQPGVSSIRLMGNYTSSEILLITDTNSGQILYSFADPSNSLNFSFKQGRSSGDGALLTDVDFQYWWQTTDTITTLELSEDTSSLTAAADIQIFVEEPSMQIRPWEFGTDAIERMRVAAPQAMLDADFEYGLQPTKWQALGLMRMYPSIYEIPGTDLSVVSITTDASSNTGSFGSSLITVTTSGTHGFTVQQPITVKGLNAAVGGFARAEGSFLVYSVPSSVSFTYFASAKVGTNPLESLYTSFVQIRQAGFYTGASIGTPTFSVFSNGSSQTVISKFTSALGSFQIAFDGTSPTVGSPISGSPNISLGTSVSGVVGSGTVVARVKNNAEPTDTEIDIVDLTGVQQAMAINAAGAAAIINSIDGNTVSLSVAVGASYIGANATVTSVTGTNVTPIGSGATFNVSRSASDYTVTDSMDSASNGTNYAVGDQLTILGTDLGGASPANDVTVTVTEIDSGGAITNFSYAGTAISGGATYTDVAQTSTTVSGVGALLTVVRTGGTGAYNISLSSGGAGYEQDEEVTFAGTSFGGASPANDIVVIVNGVGFPAGNIVDYTIIGTPVGATGDGNYSIVSATNVPVTGAGATFDVVRTDGIYSVTVVLGSAGSNYNAGNKIIISGTDLDGTSPLNDCTVTITAVASGAVSTASATGTPYLGDTISVFPTMTLSESLTGVIADGTTLNVGAIATVQVDFQSNHGLLPGTTILSSITSQPAPAFASNTRALPASGTWTGVAFSNGVYTAVQSGTANSARSIDGQTWILGGALPSSTTWTSCAAGPISGTYYVVAIASGGTASAYSINGGTTWATMGALPASATWSSITYFDEAFVAIASGGTAAAYSINGTSWTTATLPASATWSDVAGGFIGTSAYFVAVASGGTAAAFSVDKGASWVSTGALPASSTWSTVVFGNSRFFAAARGTTVGAFTTNGTTWTSVTLPASANWNCSAYGDDAFLLVADGSTSALTSFTAETGSWTSQTLAASATWEEVAYGNFSGLGRFAVIGNGTSALDVNLTSANHQIATGPHVVTQVPSPTSLRYPARTTGTINTTVQSMTGSLYARPDSYFTHRPFDGGVQLGTGGPSHGAQAIRQSKKYIRYQSGKGMMYTTGGLFAPSYNLSSAIAADYLANSFITFTCDDTDHGLQAGAEIEIIGFIDFEYNGDYTVESIIDARRFRVRANVVLSTLNATLSNDCKMILKRWHGATVRIGAFDEQNGLFYQYDGREMAVVRRSSTNQITGTVAINTESNTVTGTGTKFQDQLKVGDKIVIRGMSHIITSISDQTTMTMCPDWRGANNIVGARVCITQDLYIPQSEWNVDRLDGTGPSGYDLLPWRMQMLGMQYTWYAAGFVEFMLRGADGRFIFLHRMRNSNINTEAYMRTANLPVRYEVENRSAISKLSAAMTSSQTTMLLTDASRFPTTGTVFVDNELISYSNKSGNTLLGLTRASTFLQFTAGQNRTFSAGIAASHAVNAGVSLVTCTTSPTISHWGSALLTDGLFDEDRGYIFNYAATGLSITTAKQTAFMIRLAPSVSNAIVGDLGERDLLNRAQLLLNEIAITTDTGTGAVVVEGILNPRNYPANPTNITWTGLASSAAGGQPSFAQIALGGSINWGGVPATTTTATVQGALTTTTTARAFSTVTNTITALSNPAGFTTYNPALSTGRTDFLISDAQYDALLTTTPLRVGDVLSATGGGNPINSGQTITAITRSYNGTSSTRIVMSAVASNNSGSGLTVTVTVSSSISISYASAFSVTRNDFLITNTDATSSNITVGDSLSTSTYLVGAQTVSSLTPSYARVAGVLYTRVVISANANSTSPANNTISTTITAAGTASSYANTNFLFFTSPTWNASGASQGTRVATSFTQFPAGTSVSAVTTRRLGVTSIIRATFTQTSNASIAAAASVTWQFGDPAFALPGEQVFSFLCQPGSLNALELKDLKELTTTAIGGRGAFPNGPDVLAINVYKASGTATPGAVILRWGEAQA